MNSLAFAQAFGALLLAAVGCLFWRRNRPRHALNLCVALGLIVLAGVQAKLFVELSSLFDLMVQVKHIGADTAEAARAETSFWAGVVSLVIGGLGVNLLSAWIDS